MAICYVAPMAVFNLFSKRERRARGVVADVFVYDQIPRALRVQVVHIWREAFGDDRNIYNVKPTQVYQAIHDALAREYGLFALGSHGDPFTNLSTFFLDTDEYEKVLDIIELSFRFIERVTTDYEYR